MRWLIRGLNMPSKFGLDRRNRSRIFINVAAVCELYNFDTKIPYKKTVICQDINQEGIYFEIDELLPLKTEISLRFQLPHSKNMIFATVMVVRIQATKGLFGTGAVFTQIGDIEKEEIREFVERVDINKLLNLTIKKGASDLHLLAEYPPVLRIHGDLQYCDFPKLNADDIPHLIFSLMSKQQVKDFEKNRELDFGVQYDLNTRFRVNVHQQRGFVEAAIRLISTQSYSFEELKIPEVVQTLARQRDGLIIITGPTGSGKTTTIAAMVDLINRERKVVIVTLERPIEYMHKNIKSIIKQREVGVDTNSFADALKASLRQDPNVIVIGELDDIETVRTAIMAAEAGYLVIATFHAPDSIQAIDRLVSIFPPENRRQMLSQLSNCLKGVVAQVLLPRKDKKSRIMASEVLVVNDAVKRIVRKDEIYQLSTVMQTGSSYKMQLMSDSIRKYLEEGYIEPEVAGFYSQEFSKYL